MALPRDLQRAWIRGTILAVAAMAVGAFLAAGFVAARYEARLGQMARELSTLRRQCAQETAGLRERAASCEERLRGAAGERRGGPR